MQVRRGVGRLAVQANFEVQVGPGRVAGRADRTDRLPFLHLLTRGDEDLREVAVAGRHAAAVVYQNVVAVAAVPSSGDNRAGSGRRDRGAHRCGDVQARMEVRGAAKRVLTIAVWRGDRS